MRQYSTNSIARSSNPSLRADTFSQFGRASMSDSMTIQGTVGKTFLLLLCVLLTAGWTWMQFFKAGGNPQAVQGWMMLGLFGGLIAAFTTMFKVQWAPITAPIYALLQGLFIGGISSVFEARFPGIVIQATGLTFGVLFTMLFAYQTGIVKATEKFKLGVVAATGAIAIVYFVSFILSFFGMYPSFMYSSSGFSILFSLVVVVIAALNLVLDFDFIEKGSQAGAPKFMEWYGAFALMVTLIWLYIEFLRLLSKVRSR